jgi:glycosyltransferase involved in cell wall biosynthesis
MERNILMGQNIICFGSARSWNYSGFQQTVMRLLARHNRVLYVNALGSRRLSLKLSELPWYLKRAQRLFQKNIEQSAEFMVYNARIIPLVYNDIINKINKILLKKQFLTLISRTDFEKYILWIGTPTVAFALDLFKPVLSVYNPVDRYYAFPFVNGFKIREYERQIATRSDIIFCTSEAIKKDLLPYNEYCYTITHGVDFHRFNSALKSDIIPDDIKAIGQPIVGFFGGLDDWVNVRLLYNLAIQYPDANIVLIGSKLRDLSNLERLPNIHFLGFKNPEDLPIYLKQFKVCLIPYVINERLVAVDPIKLREYLAMGKPVVSTDLPEVRRLGDLVYIAENENDFVAKVGVAMRENSELLINERILEANRNDWEIKIEEISQIIRDSLCRKRDFKDIGETKRR